MTNVAVTTHELEARERRLDRRVRRRNLLEYLAGGAAAAFLTYAGLQTLAVADSVADLVRGIGFVALVLGLLSICVQLYRRNRERPEASPARDGLGFYLARLRRERDLLRSVWLWYVGPIVPGFALIYGSSFIEANPNWAFALAAGALTLAFLLWVIVINRRAAARLDQEIRHLGAMAEDGPEQSS